MSEPPDDTDGAGPGPHDAVGSLAEEAVRLFGALSDLARDATDEVNEHLATGSAECTWCPVCRTVHAGREAGPEVRAHLAVAASALLQAAAGVLATATSASTSTSTDPRASRTGVEHIDLDDNFDGDWPKEDDE